MKAGTNVSMWLSPVACWQTSPETPSCWKVGSSGAPPGGRFLCPRSQPNQTVLHNITLPSSLFGKYCDGREQHRKSLCVLGNVTPSWPLPAPVDPPVSRLQRRVVNWVAGQKDSQRLPSQVCHLCVRAGVGGSALHRPLVKGHAEKGPV